MMDETMKVYPSNDTTYNFEVQAFKFNGNFDQVKMPEKFEKVQEMHSFYLKDEKRESAAEGVFHG